MNTPKKLVSAIHAFGLQEQMRFEPNWAAVYENWPIEHFNALAMAEICTLRLRFRFTANCHEDWVSPLSSYRIAAAIGNDDSVEHERPLNSWVLKDPVGLVPSPDDLEEEIEWRSRLSKILHNNEIAEKTLKELGAWYVREACREVVMYERLLLEWYRLGAYEDQAGWSFGSSGNRKEFRAKLKYQQLNIADARKKLELYKRTGAPDFLIGRAADQSFREKKILDQMYAALAVRN